MISDNTVTQYTARGKTVTAIVLPTALEKARELLNCSTLTGIELEDAGASSTGMDIYTQSPIFFLVLICICVWFFLLCFDFILITQNRNWKQKAHTHTLTKQKHVGITKYMYI